MSAKLVLSIIFLLTGLNLHAKSIAAANDHLVASNSRENCRLNVPSHLVELQSSQGLNQYQVFPLRASVSEEFCQKGEVINVDLETSKMLNEESEMYITFMTMAVQAMSGDSVTMRDGLSVGEKYALDLELEVFNYQVAGLIQGDKCVAKGDKQLSVVGFLGPKGVLLRYENAGQPSDDECPNGTIALLDQSEFQNLNR